MKPILLDDNWYYFYSDNAKANYVAPDLDDSAWIPLPKLSDWAVSSSVQSGVDWFRRSVPLEPTDACVTYSLQIENVPEATEIFVNGKRVGAAQARKPFNMDVTEFVALGRNLISLRLTTQSTQGGGAFGRVRLLPTLCADETQYPMPH
ncbi:MAG: hypothetical protein SF029_17150 [bacterium]|nr:hypothetical protein [bacterium]